MYRCLCSSFFFPPVWLVFPFRFLSVLSSFFFVLVCVFGLLSSFLCLPRPLVSSAHFPCFFYVVVLFVFLFSVICPVLKSFLAAAAAACCFCFCLLCCCFLFSVHDFCFWSSAVYAFVIFCCYHHDYRRQASRCSPPPSSSTGSLAW